MDPSQLGNIPINPTFLSALQIILIAGLAYGSITIIVFILERLSDRFPARRLFFKRLQPVPQIVIYVLAVYAIIKVLGPEQESLYAILGAMALGLGLAAQDLIKDLLGGIVTLIDKPFQIGDRIRVGDYYGEVSTIGLRSTKIVTPDDSLITIPNGAILTGNISNTNAGALDCQVVVTIYLPTHVDLSLIESIARKAVLTSKDAFLNKPIIVDVRDDFGETHLTRLQVRSYVFDTRYEESYATDLTRRIKKALVSKGLIPSDVRWNPDDIGGGRKIGGVNDGDFDERIQHAMADNLMALGKEISQEK